MDWQTLIPPAIAALAAVGGVHYGARMTESREALGWIRDQRVRAYSDLLDAVDRCYAAFGLIAATLQLADYDLEMVDRPRLRTAMEDWSRWDSKMSEVLPRAELIASNSLEPLVSVGIRLGMRTRHRELLMMLDYKGEIDREEWASVERLTHHDLLRLKTSLREDLVRREPENGLISRSRRWIRRRRSIAKSRRLPTADG